MPLERALLRFVLDYTTSLLSEQSVSSNAHPHVNVEKNAYNSHNDYLSKDAEAIWPYYKSIKSVKAESYLAIPFTLW